MTNFSLASSSGSWSFVEFDDVVQKPDNEDRQGVDEDDRNCQPGAEFSGPPAH